MRVGGEENKDNEAINHLKVWGRRQVKSLKLLGYFLYFSYLLFINVTISSLLFST